MSSVEGRQGLISRVVVELEALAQQARQMGNDDHESLTIKGMVERVLSGELDPNQAVQDAREILEGKDER